MHEQLAEQVREALKMLGTGFLEDNPEMAERLASGAADLTEWFNELLRLVYRLIFLMVAEDRDLLHPANTPADVRNLYAGRFSLSALRTEAARGGAREDGTDCFERVQVVFAALARGEAPLGLPALGGLFAPGLLPNFESAHLRNRFLLGAVHRLSWLSGRAGLVPVDWRAMKTEDLGAVYESLLELQPQIGAGANSFAFAGKTAGQRGNQRKSTGSYYTPDKLVQALLNSALDPVLDRTEAETDDPASAILRLSVIDPACGSGHFLLAATRRIANRLARVRVPGTPTPVDIRHALRDVARTCIFGVDRNPFAVDLTKVALWIETVDPGLPLTFFDAQIVCGDALLGVTDLKVLEQGIPDAAFKPLAGDDRAAARYYGAKNRRERAEADKVSSGFAFGSKNDILQDFSALRAMPADSPRQVEAKQARWSALTAPGGDIWRLARLCDLYVSAFLLPKQASRSRAGSAEPPQRGGEIVPTSGTLTEYAAGGQLSSSLFGAAVDAAGAAHVLHWPLAFPDVMGSGGFDVVIGNPPYGAEVGLRENEAIKSAHPRTVSASNTCADFISLALSIMRQGGRFGLVVPKSVTYSNAWSGVREMILPHLVSTADVSQAWANVALEMVLLCCSKDVQASTELRLSRAIDRPALAMPRKAAEGLGIIPTGFGAMDQAAVEVLRPFLAPGRKQEFSTSRGKGFQKLAADRGDLKLLAGKNLAPMKTRGPWRFIEAGSVTPASVLQPGSVVFQNIVAHILYPSDHISLIGSVTAEPTVPLDTVNIIHHPEEWRPNSVAAYLMSSFVCWYVYVCGFNRAVRTMHFDNYILAKLPMTPLGLCRSLNEMSLDAPAEFNSRLWRCVDEVILAAFDITGALAEYMIAMHAGKGSRNGSTYQSTNECADRMRDAD